MLFTILFETQPPRYFDTGALVSSDPLPEVTEKKTGSLNTLTEFNLRLDMLEEYGLILQVFWYDAQVTESVPKTLDPATGIQIYHAMRRPGRYICLAEKDETADVTKVFRDSELIVWRVGEELVDGIKFAAQELLCFSDKSTTSINGRAIKIFDYLQRAHPEKSDEEIARMIGYSKTALDTVREYEDANIDLPDDEESFLGGFTADVGNRQYFSESVLKDHDEEDYDDVGNGSDEMPTIEIE